MMNGFGREWHYPMMWDFGRWGWAWMIGGALMMLLFWGGLFPLIFLAVRELWRWQ